ncbi:MAG: hypothetical protein ACFE0J_25100 [Elainellaceae cyanobacterium]
MGLTKIDAFGTEQVRYISLANAVIGSGMVGRGVALLRRASLRPR